MGIGTSSDDKRGAIFGFRSGQVEGQVRVDPKNNALIFVVYRVWCVKIVDTPYTEGNINTIRYML